MVTFILTILLPQKRDKVRGEGVTGAGYTESYAGKKGPTCLVRTSLYPSFSTSSQSNLEW